MNRGSPTEQGTRQTVDPSITLPRWIMKWLRDEMGRRPRSESESRLVYERTQEALCAKPVPVVPAVVDADVRETIKRVLRERGVRLHDSVIGDLATAIHPTVVVDADRLEAAARALSDGWATTKRERALARKVAEGFGLTVEGEQSEGETQ